MARGYDPSVPAQRLMLTDPITHDQMVRAGRTIREHCGFGGTFLGEDQVRLAVDNGYMRTLLREIWAAYTRLEEAYLAVDGQPAMAAELTRRHHDLAGHLLALRIIQNK